MTGEQSWNKNCGLTSAHVLQERDEQTRFTSSVPNSNSHNIFLIAKYQISKYREPGPHAPFTDVHGICCVVLSFWSSLGFDRTMSTELLFFTFLRLLSNVNETDC